MKKFFLILCVLMGIFISSYTALWLFVSYKVRVGVIEMLNFKKEGFLNAKFVFDDYKLKNFPFNVQLSYINPELHVSSVDTKDILHIKIDDFNINYNFFSREMLLSATEISLIDDNNVTKISNISAPLTVEMPLFSNDDKRYIVRGKNDNIHIASLNEDKKSSINFMIDFMIHTEDHTHDVSSFLKINDSIADAPIMEYDFNLKVDSYNVLNTDFDIKKIFIQKEECCSLKFDGKFGVSVNVDSDIDYSGDLNMKMVNYKNLLSQIPSLKELEGNEDVQQFAAFVSQVLIEAANEIDGDDLLLKIRKKDEILYFGTLTSSQLIDSYSKYFAHYIKDFTQ